MSRLSEELNFYQNFENNLLSLEVSTKSLGNCKEFVDWSIKKYFKSVFDGFKTKSLHNSIENFQIIMMDEFAVERLWQYCW